MSGYTYALSFAEMSAAIESAGALAQKIQSTLEAMDAETRSRLSSWTGDAQSSYTVAYAKCKTAADQMPVTLGQARSTLSQIQQGYSSAESKVASTFS